MSKVTVKKCHLFSVKYNYYFTGGVDGEVRYSPDTHIYQSEDITSTVFGTPAANGTTTPPSTPRGQFASPRLTVSSAKVKKKKVFILH